MTSTRKSRQRQVQETSWPRLSLIPQRRPLLMTTVLTVQAEILQSPTSGTPAECFTCWWRYAWRGAKRNTFLLLYTHTTFRSSWESGKVRFVQWRAYWTWGLGPELFNRSFLYRPWNTRIMLAIASGLSTATKNQYTLMVTYRRL